MNITPENLPKHELIGLEAQVVDSTDESQIGLSGEVMDETKSMLRIEDKKVEKKNCTFLFTLSDGTEVEVDGRIIDGRPEDRIGRRLPEKWEYLDYV